MIFAKYITPEEAIELGDTRSLKELRKLARQNGNCEVCDQPVWKFGGTGMCFSCTTGEADSSEDYELQ